jgi:hypothetical protein
MSAQQEKFDKATELLKKLGVEYGVKNEYRGEVGKGRKPVDLPILSTVNMHFSADEWCHMASRDGAEYIGGCCGQTSHAQDILCHIFRMTAHWIPIRDLEELALTLEGHNDVLEFPEVSFDGMDISVEEAVGKIESGEVKWEEMGCWSRLALVWHIVKDAYDPEAVSGYPEEKTDTLDNAIFISSRVLQSFSFEKLFAKNEKTGSQAQASRILRLYKLIPSLEMVYNKVSELYDGPLDGYALWDLKNNTIATNGFGPCVFYTENECNELLDQWERTAEEYEDGMNQKRKGVRDRLGIRKVRITKEKGLELV